jgi:hypothetical protein
MSDVPSLRLALGHQPGGSWGHVLQFRILTANLITRSHLWALNTWIGLYHIGANVKSQFEARSV